jgi:hypothetical protein
MRAFILPVLLLTFESKAGALQQLSNQKSSLHLQTQLHANVIAREYAHPIDKRCAFLYHDVGGKHEKLRAHP